MIEFGGLLKLASDCWKLKYFSVCRQIATSNDTCADSEVPLSPLHPWPRENRLLYASVYCGKKLVCARERSTLQAFSKLSFSLSHSGVPAWSWVQTVEIVPDYYFLINIQEIVLSLK